MDLILASASPRRQELLKYITSDFTVIPSEVDETVPKRLKAKRQPEFLARLKALDIAEKYPKNTVIGADTCVIIGNQVLGKPKDMADAKRMLLLLSGKTHKVITGCAIVKNGLCKSFSQVSKVTFYKLSLQEIEEYVNSSEPYDKAGSYAIQSKGGLFVKKIKGDYFNIVGLPVGKLKRELRF